MGCRRTGRQTLAEGEGSAGRMGNSVNSISYTKPQSKAKQNVSDDRCASIRYIGGDSVPVMLRKCIATGTCLKVGGVAVTTLGFWAARGRCFISSRTARGRQDRNLLSLPLLPQNKPFHN